MVETRKEVTPEQYEVMKAVLGADAETFNRTNLGQYVNERIETELEKLNEELHQLALKSSDLEVARKALDINMHRMLPRFIGEAIQSGHSARNNIDQMEANANSY